MSDNHEIKMRIMCDTVPGPNRTKAVCWLYEVLLPFNLLFSFFLCFLQEDVSPDRLYAIINVGHYRVLI